MSVASYLLYEPNNSILREYKGGLEKAIPRNGAVLDKVIDAFFARPICN